MPDKPETLCDQCHEQKATHSFLVGLHVLRFQDFRHPEADVRRMGGKILCSDCAAKHGEQP